MKSRILSLFLAFCLLFSIAILPLSAADGVELVTETIDSTTAYEDLSKATNNGVAINMDRSYPLNKSADEKEFEFITFVEVGYKNGIGPNGQNDYALYAYVYYPRGTRLITSSTKHTITLATAYNKTDAAGEAQTDPADWRATAYNQFTMTLVNFDESATTGYLKYPVLKFKVNVTAAELSAGFTASGDQRRYDVSRVDMQFRSTANPMPFEVGHSIICSGYRADKTFSMSTSDLAVVPIDIEQTHYRFANKSDLNQKTQISTVYFALDKDFGDQWDKINAITARWFEAHSSPMVMTSDQALYEEYMGISGSDYSKGIKYIGMDLTLLSPDKLPERTIATYDSYLPGTIGAYGRRYFWQYNSLGPNAQPLSSSSLPLAGNCNKLMWFFDYPVGTHENKGEWGQSLVGANISTEELQEYFYTKLQELGWENSTWDNNLLYTTGLVTRSVDEGRTYGWQTHTIDSPIKVEGFEYGSGLTGWWNKLVLGDRDTDIDPIEPIQVVDSAHFYAGKDLMDDTELCREYLVAESDLAAFKEFCTAAFAAEQTVICFHFAATEYYSAPLGILCNYPIVDTTMYENLANVSQQTLFLDFTVLDFHCTRDGETVVVPVASNTIDVIGDNEASDNIRNPDTGGGLDISNGFNGLLNDLKSAFAVIIGVLAVVIIVILAINLIGPTATAAGAIGSGLSSAAKGVSNAVKKKKRKRKK